MLVSVLSIAPLHPQELPGARVPSVFYRIVRSPRDHLHDERPLGPVLSNGLCGDRVGVGAGEGVGAGVRVGQGLG